MVADARWPTSPANPDSDQRLDPCCLLDAPRCDARGSCSWRDGWVVHRSVEPSDVGSHQALPSGGHERVCLPLTSMTAGGAGAGGASSSTLERPLTPAAPIRLDR
jgi:hypothetical protein